MFGSSLLNDVTSALSLSISSRCLDMRLFSVPLFFRVVVEIMLFLIYSTLNTCDNDDDDDAMSNTILSTKKRLKASFI